MQHLTLSQGGPHAAGRLRQLTQNGHQRVQRGSDFGPSPGWKPDARIKNWTRERRSFSDFGCAKSTAVSFRRSQQSHSLTPHLRAPTN